MPVPVHFSLTWRFLPRAFRRACRALRNREAITVLAFTGLSIVGGLVGNKLLTTYATPDALGELYLYTNLAMWLTLPTAGGYIYVVHHWPIAREHHATRRFARGMGLALAAQTTLILLGVAVFFFAMPTVLRSFAMAACLAALATGTAAFQALSPVPGAERWRVTSGILGLLGGALRQFALVCGIILFALSSGEQLLVVNSIFQLASSAFASVIFLVILRRALREPGEASKPTPFLTSSSFLSYTVPGFFGVVAAQVASSAERWGLAQFDQTAATALFVQSIGISTAASGAVGSVLTTYFYPFITSAAAHSSDPLQAAKPTLKRFLMLTVAGQAAVAAGAILFASQITRIAFGARFVGVQELLPWTTLGAALFSVGQALTIVLFTARDAIWPNLGRILSQALYATGLLFLPHNGNLGRLFSQYYALGQVIYLLLILYAIFRCIRKRRQEGPADDLSPHSC